MTKLSSSIDLIKKSINIFSKKDNLIYFVKIYAFLLPFSIFSLFQGYFVDPQTLQPKNVWFTAIIILVNIAYLFVYILVAAAGIEAVGRVVSNERLIIKNTFTTGVKKYWKFLLLTIILFFIVGFGFILLIIPGIIFMTWFAFSSFILIKKEKVSLKYSLSESKKLSEGKFWQVLGRVIVFSLFSSLASMLFSLIPYIGSILITVFGALFVLPSYLLYQELAGE